MVQHLEQGLGQEQLRVGRVQAVEEDVAQCTSESVHVEQWMLIVFAFVVLLPQMLEAGRYQVVLDIVALGGQH